MIAMTVLVVVATALGGSMVSSNNLSRQSRETRIASLELAQVMESVLASPQGDIPVDFVDGTPIQQNSPLNNLVITPGYPNLPANGQIPELLTIVLQATWTTFNGGERSITLTSAKAS